MASPTVLADDAFVVPPAVGHGWDPGSIGWLRASVARFSSGELHRRRRALILAELSRVDVAAVRAAAGESTLGTTDAARSVPVTVLAQALGAPSIPVAAVAAVAAVYLTGTGGGREAQAGLDALVTAFGGVPDERTAALISLLVQTCQASATLIEAAVATGAATGDDAVAQVLRDAPPVPRTRRVAVVDTRVDGRAVATGTTVQVDLAQAPFGAGPHECPGQEIAVAIAAAAVDSVRRAAPVRP
jgi:hypothetical protein